MVGITDKQGSDAHQASIESDVGLLTNALEKQFQAQLPIADYAWPSPAQNVLECVLSLNRRYDGFCWPRVRNFALKHPSVCSLEQLSRLIAQYPTPFDFGREELQMEYEDRMRIIGEVNQYLRRQIEGHDLASEIRELRKWALQATSAECDAAGIHGFKLSGFQYLRMLFAAQTTKPDVHILSAVESALGRAVSDRVGLRLLETVADMRQWRLRDLDFALWERGSRQNPHALVAEDGATEASGVVLPPHVESLLGRRFDGFDSIASTRESRCSRIPDRPGVYMIIRPIRFDPRFVTQSPAGRFKGRDPGAAVATLRDKWVDGAFALYVGKAGGSGNRSTLRSRVWCYLQHGAGKPVAHWGGRYIWQLERADNLLVAWSEENASDPAEVERTLIQRFADTYGRMPFANLKLG